MTCLRKMFWVNLIKTMFKIDIREKRKLTKEGCRVGYPRQGKQPVQMPWGRSVSSVSKEREEDQKGQSEVSSQGNRRWPGWRENRTAHAGPHRHYKDFDIFFCPYSRELVKISLSDCSVRAQSIQHANLFSYCLFVLYAESRGQNLIVWQQMQRKEHRTRQWPT